jgi:hypothetical protein
MSQAGFTPIQLYYSGTTTSIPSAGNLAFGELAINITDGRLFFKNSSNVVVKIADAAAATGSVIGGTAGALVYQSAASTSAFVNIGSNGFVLTSNGTIPVYTNPASITVGTATTATNLAGGAANRVAYQTGAGTTDFAPAPSTAGFVLGWTGSAFSWVSAPAATSAINLSGGGANTIVYQSATGTTAYLANGTTGQVLGANTGGAPSWVAGGSNAYTRTEYTATAGQTTFAVTYTVGYVQVYLNGVLLAAVDYTASSGTSVVLAAGAALNDVVEFLAFNTTPITTTSTSNLLGGTAGQVAYQSAPGATAFAGPGTTGQPLLSNGATAPTFGTLPVNGGGTGAATLAVNNVLLGNGTSALQAVAPGTNGNVLTSNGTTWASAALPAGISLSAANTWTGTQTFSGTASTQAIVLNDAAEVATVSATAATGTIAYDITTQSVLYYTSNASANWTVNLRGSSGTSLNTLMTTGQSMTVAFLVTQGATAYFNNVVQVDGATAGVTTRWIGGAPTAGNASGIDSYRYLIIKTGSATFTVLASVVQFKA